MFKGAFEGDSVVLAPAQRLLMISPLVWAAFHLGLSLHIVIRSTCIRSGGGCQEASSEAMTLIGVSRLDKV
jgi:hypothetical protein